MNGERNPRGPTRLHRAQAISGLIFGLFALLHLSTHVAAVGGPDVYDRVQAALRRVYQAPVLELGFLGALVVHMATAVLGVRARRRAQASRSAPNSVPARLRWHRIAGWFLFAVIVGHVVATRVLPMAHGIGVGFEGVAFAFWWLPLLFWPYYTALALFGLYHLAHGSVLAFGRLRRPVPAKLRSGRGFWLPVGVFGLALVFALLALDGRLFDTPDPWDNDYARIYGEQFGVELPGR